MIRTRWFSFPLLIGLFFLILPTLHALPLEDQGVDEVDEVSTVDTLSPGRGEDVRAVPETPSLPISGSFSSTSSEGVSHKWESGGGIFGTLATLLSPGTPWVSGIIGNLFKSMISSLKNWLLKLTGKPANAPPAPQTTSPRPTAGSGANSSQKSITGGEENPTSTPGSPVSSQQGSRLTTFPPRPSDAATGSEFARSWAALKYSKREEAVLAELEKGNFPSFLRQLKEVKLEWKGKDGVLHTGKVFVMPDYLAIGSDQDYLRVPMTPRTAQLMADKWGCVLPTAPVVDAVYKQATQKLGVQPLTNDASTPQMIEHNQKVQKQFEEKGFRNGELTVGHKKDVINHKWLEKKPTQVAIYGWHNKANGGKPIQPESTIHDSYHVDYSHGVRLMAGTMEVDGKRVPVDEVIKNPSLAGILTGPYGAFKSSRVPGGKW